MKIRKIFIFLLAEICMLISFSYCTVGGPQTIEVLGIKLSVTHFLNNEE